MHDCVFETADCCFDRAVGPILKINVFQFDVSVDDFLIMDHMKSFEQLDHDFRDFVFGKIHDLPDF